MSLFLGSNYAHVQFSEWKSTMYSKLSLGVFSINHTSDYFFDLNTKLNKSHCFPINLTTSSNFFFQNVYPVVQSWDSIWKKTFDEFEGLLSRVSNLSMLPINLGIITSLTKLFIVLCDTFKGSISFWFSIFYSVNTTWINRLHFLSTLSHLLVKFAVVLSACSLSSAPISPIVPHKSRASKIFPKAWVSFQLCL